MLETQKAIIHALWESGKIQNEIGVQVGCSLSVIQNIARYYLPTPLLGQDMTQGQFFKQSLTGLNSEFSFS